MRNQIIPAHMGFRTANAMMAAAIMASAMAPAYNASAVLKHESITTANADLYDPKTYSEELTAFLDGNLRTANASLFTQAHFSQPLTQYATGWTDAASYRQRSEFLAPSLPPTGERFEFITYPNAEAFLSDDANEDLRPIGSDFKTVDFTSDKSNQTIPNRGLRIVLDSDKIKEMPDWEQHYTQMLLKRLERNAFRRKVALAVAAATNVPLVWDAAGEADPDYNLANEAAASGDVSGITPNCALWGLGAKLLRLQTYGATNKAAAVAGRGMTPEQASAMAGLTAMVDESRYQTGTTKTRIVGSTVLLFTKMGTSTSDPSNFKTARGNTQSGGFYGVYVRQLSVKQWEITVEVYETEFCASPLGVTLLSITAS